MGLERRYEMGSSMSKPLNPRLLPSALLVVAGAMVAGCSDVEGDQPMTGSASEADGLRPSGAWEFDESATAEVDRQAGTIELPLDGFDFTREELAVVDSAATLSIYLCAEAAGVEGGTWEPYEVSPLPPRDERRFGVWVRQYAETYGYALPPAPDVPLNNAVEEARDVYVECAENGDIGWPEDLPSGDDIAADLDGIEAQIFAAPDGVAVQAEWEACIEESGLQRDLEDPAPFSVVGEGSEVNEEQIRMALADVTCKEQVNYVERLADLEAGFQQPVIDEYIDELSAQRAEIDRIVEDSRQYLALNAP